MRTIRLSFPWRRVVALFFACLVCTALWAEAAQSQLADKVIRLHVLANSDSQADQALKRYVRDQVLAQTTPLLEGVTSAPEAEAILQANLGLLTQTAQVAIAAQGYDYSVSVRLEETWFPTRQYQDVALPAGNYQALRVLIGEAEGHNWWCVIFLPLPAGRQRGFPGGRRPLPAGLCPDPGGNPGLYLPVPRGGVVGGLQALVGHPGIEGLATTPPLWYSKHRSPTGKERSL